MKKIKFKKKTIVLIISIAFIVLLFFSSFETVFGMTHYQNTDFVTGLVTATALNVRSGPRNRI